jgi:hypothetical protein
MSMGESSRPSAYLLLFRSNTSYVGVVIPSPKLTPLADEAIQRSDASSLRLKTIGFSLVGLVTLVVALFVWLLADASGSWQKRAAKAVAEARARDSRRQVLRGEAMAGSAWVDYQQAIAAVTGVQVNEVTRWLSGGAADRVKVEAILAANEKAIHFLRAGARKAEGTYPLRWEDGFRSEIPPLLAVNNLTTLAVGQARVLTEAGKTREAADLLIDTAQYGADLGRNAIIITELTGLSSLGPVFDGLRRLPPDPEVGRALAMLDATFPSHAEAVLNELAVTGMGFMNMPAGFSTSATWRFGFSGRLMIADAWTTLDDLMRQLAATTTMPCAEAQRVTATIETRATKRKNPLVANMISGLARSDRSARARRAQLRLLRVLHGGATGLDDPFGGKLLSDGGRVWSVGEDGIDAKGAGAWKPATTGDIVLELPTK